MHIFIAFFAVSQFNCSHYFVLELYALSASGHAFVVLLHTDCLLSSCWFNPFTHLFNYLASVVNPMYSSHLVSIVLKLCHSIQCIIVMLYWNPAEVKVPSSSLCAYRGRQSLAHGPNLARELCRSGPQWFVSFNVKSIPCPPAKLTERWAIVFMPNQV